VTTLVLWGGGAWHSNDVRPSACTIPAGTGIATDRPCRHRRGSSIVQLDQLLQDVATTRHDAALPAVAVSTIAFDHRRVVEGALFCCLRGEHHDGHEFAAAAVEKGAVALLVDHQLPLSVPQVVVGADEVRRVMAIASCRLWGEPSRTLTTVGVTGTNGKTSVTHLLAAVLEAADRPTTVIGTLSGARTTPEAPDLQCQLAASLASGQRAAAVEVSSHALVQARVHGTWFAAGVFTNLAHDHLDFHGTMEAYFAAKALLFEEEHCAQAVVNGDDRWGRVLVERLQRRGVRVRTYSLDDAGDIESDAQRTAFSWRGHRVSMTMAGGFQVANALAAATTAAALGVEDDTIVAGLARARPVPGRFEVVAGPPSVPFTVVVDFAHTPDALAAALYSARAITGPGGQVRCVFGCGGDRDRAKRPDMGSVAAAGADMVVVTADNARGEDVGRIADEVMAGIGVEARRRTSVLLDRRAAIEAAVNRSSPGDVVLVAGKGHERTLDVGGRSVPFDDRQVAVDAVAAAGYEVER
jgi:UDP-N-acetylmuramoyl-L-alanyl-D-glutamate--2,6-diaminopimelate ligase